MFYNIEFIFCKHLNTVHIINVAVINIIEYILYNSYVFSLNRFNYIIIIYFIYNET